MLKKNITLVPNKNYNHFFAFITTSCNQSQFIIKNLDSIRMQKYKNYKVYYVNDGSTDNTEEMLNEYVTKYPDFNIEIINSKVRGGPCYARYMAYMRTNDSDICVFLDGDDFLIDENVLNIVAEAYDTNDVYATFGTSVFSHNRNTDWQFERMINYDRRTKGNYFPHLRTVKSFILKKIPDTYLKDRNNNWFMVTTDIALFTAVTELCKDKYMFILNRLVIYNVYNRDTNKEDGYHAQKDLMKIRRINYIEDITSMPKLLPYRENKNQHIENFTNTSVNFELILVFLLLLFLFIKKI